MALPSKRTSADFTFKHTGQVDEYGASVGDATIVQENFDQRAIDNMDAINDLIDSLSATTDGASGADSIGMTAIADLSGTTVQSIVESLKDLVDANEADIENKVSTLEDKVDTNETDIEDKVSTLETKVDTNETDIENKVTALKGTGYVDETVRGNAEDLITLETKVDSNETDIEDKVATLDSKVDSNESDIENKVTNLKGSGYTDQTVKDNYDRIIGNDNDISALESDKADKADVYTKTNMQTSGQSQLHWENLTNVPNMADSSWKPAVSHYDNLPTTGNSVDDMRVVADDGDGKSAIYRCDTTSGTREEQWEKLADLDWTNDHGALVGLSDDDHTQYIRVDGNRAFTGNVDLGGNELLDFLVHHESTLPEGANGQLIYHTHDNSLKLKIPSGWVKVSGQGAVIREVEITATEGQTVFDVGQSGTYQYSTDSGVMNVYKKNAEGYYELLDKDDYDETDNETITLNTGVSEGTEMYFKWQYNLASIANALEDDGVTNAKLASDIKVGSLSELTTSAKDSVTDALNELDSDKSDVGHEHTSSAITDFASSVRDTLLEGLSTATNAVISATDSVLTALGKLQAQITDHIGSGGSAHSDATTSSDGFMSSSDKSKLNGIESGAEVNSVDSVAGKTGDVTLSKSDIGLDNVENITISSGTADPSGGSDGDIYLQYE